MRRPPRTHAASALLFLLLVRAVPSPVLSFVIEIPSGVPGHRCADRSRTKRGDSRALPPPPAAAASVAGRDPGVANRGDGGRGRQQEQERPAAQRFDPANTPPSRPEHDPADYGGPTFRSNLVISDLAERSARGDPGAAGRAENVLVRLEEAGEADTVSYNGVIKAYGKAPRGGGGGGGSARGGEREGGGGRGAGDDGARRAREVLERMEEVHETQVEAVRRWEEEWGGEWRRREEQQRQQHRKVRDIAILEGDDGASPLPPPPPRVRVKPNVRTYATLIDAYARSPDLYPPEESESLLERVRELHRTTGDPDLAPNPYVINAVLNVWAKSGRGAEGAARAEELLDEAEGMGLADVVGYNTAIDAWARSGADDAGIRAEALLRRMQDRHGDGEDGVEDDGDEEDDTTGVQRRRRLRPNVRTYSSVIDAWSRTRLPTSARRADSILREVENRYESTGDESLRPNAYVYSTVINAYARSREAGKATAALVVLRRMEELWRSGKNVDARPTVVVYNSVLNACATTPPSSSTAGGEAGAAVGGSGGEGGTAAARRDEAAVAMAIVRALYHELTGGGGGSAPRGGPAAPPPPPGGNVRPDHFTYGTVLKACTNLLPTKLDDPDLVRSVFERCCSDGQVTFGVCFQLRQAAPAELYRDLIPPEAFDREGERFVVEDMPWEWRRNVRERRGGARRPTNYQGGGGGVGRFGR